MAVRSKPITNVQENLRLALRAIEGLSYISQSIICLLKLGNMAISRFLSLKNRVSLVDPFHCCCGSVIYLLGFETACVSIENQPRERC